MSIAKQLTKAYNTARVVDFDDRSKIILFSDCHRGDNGWADDFANNQCLFYFALLRYYQKGFTYIELGDGDELYKNARFSVIRSAHSHIFWLLREFYLKNRLYLLHGNHDMERANPKVAAKTLTSYYDEVEKVEKPLLENIEIHESLILRHTPSGGKFLLLHGHQGDLLNDRLWKVGRFFVRSLWRWLQMLGIHDPTSPARNFRKRNAVERQIDQWAKENHQWVIFGHTHRSHFPLDNKTQYFNTGSCVHPRCITGIEISGGNIQLLKWWVEADEKTGHLAVTGQTLVKPQKVASFFAAGNK